MSFDVTEINAPDGAWCHSVGRIGFVEGLHVSTKSCFALFVIVDAFACDNHARGIGVANTVLCRERVEPSRRLHHS